MPQFIDHHAMSPKLAPEMQQGIAERLRSGEPDEFGVTGLNVYVGKDGTAFCLSEAPGAAAVVQAHEAAGFQLDEGQVVEVEAIV